MDRVIASQPASLLRSLWLLGGAIATAAAVAVGAVLAVFFAATVVVIAVMATFLLGLAGLALRARRRARARAGSATDLIEARHLGGHHWVAYGWSERA